MGQRDDAPRHARIARRLGDIMLLATCFHDVFMDPFVQRPLSMSTRGVPLSARERQCRQMAAHGLTSAEIGVKLGIVSRTVDFHFHNVVAKLLNRQGAIARGIAVGLVRIKV